MPLYLTVKEAAEYVGVGVNTMRDCVNSADPPPFLRVGNRKMLQRDALGKYFEKKQEVRLNES